LKDVKVPKKDLFLCNQASSDLHKNFNRPRIIAWFEYAKDPL